MKVHYRLDSMKLIKQRTLDMLKLNQGESVIELGCGLGHDAEAMADSVKGSGCIVAIDNSRRMLQEAIKFSTHSNVEYHYGDVNHLNFADCSFSACRADRLLVSQPDINQVLSEAIRIIKPNGKLCVTDLDFATIIISPYLVGITELIVKYWQSLVLNPFIGRKLPALFKQHGLMNIKIQPEVFIVTSYETLKEIVPFETMLDDMVCLKQITNQQKLKIINAFEKVHNENEFFWSINLFTVVGQKNP